MDRFKELSFEEMQEVDGGLVWVWGAIAVGLATNFLYEVVNDWENNVKAFNEGYESFKK
ncbi:class IIb bacteriocin, lactobin A/cerein 7B family [Algoriphagus alkaliphilus]|uniref:Class IIb bacteriocin, lactobin A/cerein 7B family n=1 Tax=Algoriphagus alkaliphilus TaxID=279824 RepID=A0A1G5Y9A1_9BACT|nr:class IIb bacteriocin, lactobin A/cerein 7B family [Algoriphagus alkaliphilus]SDA79173.1 class IIb bacteriocin, lactobin A/cerein 7B family [Algoriphagus alkaliphilus]